VSVILPAYNLRDTLGRAIDSVVGQSLGAWELLVVDDASDDDIGVVVARYDDPRIRAIRRTVNGGVAAAQNTGIDHARGEFVAFLHSDDMLLAEKLQRQVDLLASAGASVGAVESAIEVEWPERVELWTPTLDTATAFDLLAYRNRVHISGLMIRRALAAQLRFDERLRGAEDRDFCARLLRSTDVVCSQEPLSRVSKTGPRLSHQNKGPIYVYLLAKYHDDIATDRRVHADWNYRIARAFARAGHMREARDAIRRSMRLFPAHPRRWPLWLASFGGDRLTRAAFRVQVRSAELAERARRP
jgi:glycosyltransferase involved in cell wall biosynthesis